MNLVAASDPHQGQPVLQFGSPLAEAQAAVIMVHGRGASASDILTLAPELQHTGVSFLAPQAAGSTWYPYRFLASLSDNEPYLSSALAAVGRMLDTVAAQGIAPEKTMLLGFSQGACLALEYGVRYGQRYGGLVGLSGGLIGPPRTTWDFGTRLDATPVFLGCSDVDAHIPLSRVDETAVALEKLGAVVTKRIYPRMGHTVNADEIEFVAGMVAALLA
jgi:predicted esterase